MLLIILVQGFCPLKIKITQFAKVTSSSFPGSNGNEVDHFFVSGCYLSFASSCFDFKMEDVEMYSDHLLFNKRQLGPIGQHTT